MALTIISAPSSICFSKNLIKYIVNTDADKEVRARIWIEDSPYSATYSFITELKSIPDSSGNCTFQLSQILDENLDYHTPSFFADEEVINSARRFYVEFYEYDADDLVLHDEVYSADGSYQSIAALDDALNYVIIQESIPYSTANQFRFLLNVQSPDLAYNLDTESWASIDPNFPFDEYRPPAKVKVTIYEGSFPALTTSSVAAVLKGGESIVNFFLEIQAPVISLSPQSDTQINVITSSTQYETEIECSDDDGDTWLSVATLEVGVNLYEHTSLSAGTYTYRSKATLDDTSSKYSKEVSVTLLSSAFQPDGSIVAANIIYSNDQIYA